MKNPRMIAWLLTAATVVAGSGAALAQKQSAPESIVLPRTETPFKGKIGRTASEFTPDFPKGITAPKAAPNVLLILTDDVGFGASSTFGGAIPTPTMDQLAKAGLSYNTFHTTALCSPTRAALITGRNHHTNATGVITEMGTGFPGYHSVMQKALARLAKSSNRMGTTHPGSARIITCRTGCPVKPDRLTFGPPHSDLNISTASLAAILTSGTLRLSKDEADRAEEQRGPDPKHFDEILADKAISWIRLQHSLAPDKPFFAYYAPGLTHAPHHAPKEWIAKFKGQFDQGWDKLREETYARQLKKGVIPAGTKLTERPKEIPAWDLLDADQKRLFARMMEVYAGSLAYVDYNIGRVAPAVEETGEMDNTLIIYQMGDNGASGEGTLQGLANELGVIANGVQESIPYLLSIMDDLGGPKTYNHYPVGWAHAMDTPFQWTKQVASHFGGTRNGLVISWPKRIKQAGEVRLRSSAMSLTSCLRISAGAGMKAPRCSMV